MAAGYLYMAPASPGMAADRAGFTGRFDDDAQAGRSGSIGILRAIGTALAVDLLSVPIAVFVASMPLLRLANRRPLPRRIARRDGRG